jgi:hypothetical protein
MSGATAAPGSPVDFTGTDILHIEGGLLAEYWLNSDVHVMAAQLGMTASPVQAASNPARRTHKEIP